VRRINRGLGYVTGQAEGGSVQAIVTQEAARAGVPQRIAHAVIRVESGYNCRARNPSGAAGAGQLMPATARAMGVRNPRTAGRTSRARCATCARRSARAGQGARA
jgi:soluble lytic murein transglycosylase-like protein